MTQTREKKQATDFPHWNLHEILLALTRALSYVPVLMLSLVLVGLSVVGVIQLRIPLAGGIGAVEGVLILGLTLIIVLFRLATVRRGEISLKGAEAITKTPEEFLDDEERFARKERLAKEIVLEYLAPKVTGKPEWVQTNNEVGPDLLLVINGKKYLVEIKARLLVPSDLYDASEELMDYQARDRNVAGVFLLTSTAPPEDIAQLAKTMNVHVEVLPLLSITKW